MRILIAEDDQGNPAQPPNPVRATTAVGGPLAGRVGVAIAPRLQPFMAHREHPLGNPSPARVMAGVAAQL